MNASQFQLIQQRPQLTEFLQHWEELDAERSFTEMFKNLEQAMEVLVLGSSIVLLKVFDRLNGKR